MPRLPRLHVPGALYVVTCRGIAVGASAEPIFRDQQDYEMYLQLLGEYKHRRGVKVFAYGLLPDQVHLCLEVNEQTTISAIMHDVTSCYTKYFNKRYTRQGHLFLERFKSVLVEKEPYLLPVTMYLHRLPVLRNLTFGIAEYSYTSYAAYTAQACVLLLEMGLEVAEVKTQLDIASPGLTYEQASAQCAEADLHALQDALRQNIIGSEAFVQRVREQLHVKGLSSWPEAAPAVSPTVNVVPVPSMVTDAPRRAPVRPAWVAVGCLLAGMGIGLYALTARVNLLEGTLAAITQENDAQFRARVSTAVFQEERPPRLADTLWDIRMVPVGGAVDAASHDDYLTFTQHQMSSASLAAQGFSNAEYTLTVQPDGIMVWDTTQQDAAGNLIHWRGETEGTLMKGEMTRQISGQAPETFTFVGVTRRFTNTRREI